MFKTHQKSEYKDGTMSKEVLGDLILRMWSHDEACASSTDPLSSAWIKADKGGIHSKSSGKKLVAAELVCIWGKTVAEMPDEQFASARKT